MDRFIFFLQLSRIWGQSPRWTLVAFDGAQALSRAQAYAGSSEPNDQLNPGNILASHFTVHHLANNFTELNICPCLPTWRDDMNGSLPIALIGKIENKEASFLAFNYRYVPGNVEELGPNARGMILFEGVDRPGVKVPFASPYSSEKIKTTSQAGRCILASTNNMHKATRYYTFSISQLLNGNPKFGPINFGRNAVGPEVLCMDHFSGAIAYPSRDEKNLTLEFFD